MFNHPLGVCVDLDGSIIVADTYNHRIRKINLNRYVSTISENGEKGLKDGPSTTAMSHHPHNVCIDVGGDIIVLDCFNQRIKKINLNGDVSTISGTGCGFKDGPLNKAMFSQPSGVCVDLCGNIIVVDMFNCRIRKISSNRDVSLISGTKRSGFKDEPLNTLIFNQPHGVCVDLKGNIIVVDTRIRKIKSNGDVLMIAGTKSNEFDEGISNNVIFNNPGGVCLDLVGNIIVVDNENHKIERISCGVKMIEGDFIDHLKTIFVN